MVLREETREELQDCKMGVKLPQYKEEKNESGADADGGSLSNEEASCTICDFSARLFPFCASTSCYQTCALRDSSGGKTPVLPWEYKQNMALQWTFLLLLTPLLAAQDQKDADPNISGEPQETGKTCWLLSP